DDALCPVLTREPVVESQLETLLAGVVDVGETEQMARHLARRVVAAVFAGGVQTGNAERPDLFSRRRLPGTGYIEELAIEIAGHAPGELEAIDLQRRGETRNLVGRERELRGVHPDGVDGGADREWLAVAVGHRAAVSGNLEHPREPGIALPGE